MSGWAIAAQIGGELLGQAMSAHSAHKANRTNIKLQREQQDWEERMANTAVQRRVKDIIAAGGNPATAFVNGGEATTPTVAPARVEPFRYNNPNLGSALMMAATLKQMAAQTKATEADARVKNVEADIREKLKPQEQEVRANKFIEQQEWDDLKTSILRHQDVSTAAEARRLRETVDSLIAQARQQARAGKLDLDALENIAKVGGIEAGKTKDIIKLIIDLIRK